MQKLSTLFLAEQERWILWLPVCFALGILTYFSLNSEPPLWLGVTALGFSLAAIFCFRKHTLFLCLFLGLFFTSVGFLTIHLRSISLLSPVITKETGILRIEGRIAGISPLPSGKRIIFDQLLIPEMEAEATPVKIRLIVRTNSDDINIGDIVSFRAALSPPPPPVLPGGYDFSRMAFFKQIGAIGYTVSNLNILISPPSPSFAQRLYNFRERMAAHIVAVMGPRTGTITTALILGVDSAIDKTILAEMRASGLSHILSVSGMHLSLVAALFFFLTRSVLVLLCEPLALHMDIKKPAAAVAILASLGYYLISGMQVAAFRSFIMTALVILAIMLNRISTPLRSVALAALIVLIFQPESVMDVSFQMSFAAVIALFATYDMSQNYRDFFLRYGIGGHIFTYVAGVAFSSLIAGMATAPFAMYHFNQYANYSILANLLAVPLTSFLIMPLAVLAFFLYLLGADGIALKVMGWGVEGLITISHHVSALPASVKLMPLMPLASLLLIVIGGLWLCVWHSTMLRLAGLLPIILAVVLMLIVPEPDILIDGKGKLFAVRDGHGELMVSSKRHGRYARTMWLRQNGQTEAIDFTKEEWEDEPSPILCDADSCRYAAKNKLTIFALSPEGLQNDCNKASILINLTESATPCPAPYLITLRDLAQNGTYMLFLEGDNVRAKTVGEMRGKRLWSGYQEKRG